MTSWTPAVTLDLGTASGQAFEDAKAKFNEWSKAAPPADLSLKDGWLTVIPEIAEKMLRRNAGNRKVGLGAVKQYADDMKSGGWMETSQGIGFDEKDQLVDGQHRLWACYLSGESFKVYVVTKVPAHDALFAFYDMGKGRNAADALYTAGVNGLSATIAGAAQISANYDAKTLRVNRSKGGKKLSAYETLVYAKQRPDLIDAAHVVEQNFSRAVNVIGSKPVAAFFGWKAITAYGERALESFMIPLGSGANLAEDSVILGLRNRLMNAGNDEDTLSKSHRLALLIKGFLMHVAGAKLPKRGLYLRDNEAFPRLEPSEAQTPAEAAE